MASNHECLSTSCYALLTTDTVLEFLICAGSSSTKKSSYDSYSFLRLMQTWTWQTPLHVTRSWAKLRFQGFAKQNLLPLLTRNILIVPIKAHSHNQKPSGLDCWFQGFEQDLTSGTASSHQLSQKENNSAQWLPNWATTASHLPWVYLSVYLQPKQTNFSVFSAKTNKFRWRYYVNWTPAPFTCNPTVYCNTFVWCYQLSIMKCHP